MTEEQLTNWFTHHVPSSDQVKAHEALRSAGRALAKVINRRCPESADKTTAIRKVREAVMTANASIACGGK